MSVLRPSLRVTSRRLAGALLWMALLGGVLAMHGLSTHGIMGSPEAAMATVYHGAGAIHDAMPADHRMTPAGRHAPDGGHMGTVMLCVAILVATIIAGRMAGFLRRRPISTVQRLDRRALPRPGTTHPPPLARLAVMRC